MLRPCVEHSQLLGRLEQHAQHLYRHRREPRTDHIRTQGHLIFTFELGGANGAAELPLLYC